jgi:DNA-binding Xre family transcriptional regulator
MNLGRTVTLQEVAEATKITEAALSRVERDQNERIDYRTLVKLCEFYSEALGRPIGVGDVLEFDPNNRTPGYASDLVPA